MLIYIHVRVHVHVAVELHDTVFVHVYPTTYILFSKY